ncbi:MAG: hypothetical protein GX640_11520 [Fibrobacter sp.]|nr:hypothetical protein [Fibrobacter sp.]
MFGLPGIEEFLLTTNPCSDLKRTAISRQLSFVAIPLAHEQVSSTASVSSIVEKNEVSRSATFLCKPVGKQ